MDLTIQVEQGHALGEAEAASIRDHQGVVRIVGMSALSDNDAHILSCHRGDLHLPDLITLSKTAARLLAGHAGTLYLEALEHISDAGLAALCQHPNAVVPPSLRDRSERYDEGSPRAKSESEDRGGQSQTESAHNTEARSHEHADPAIGVQGGNEDRLDALLRPLEQLVGLEDVKRTVRSVVALARIAAQRRRSGLSVAPASYHMAFFGPPGTGKTTVARLVASILKKAGVLSSGHLVETDGQGLLAKYLGQTGHRVKDIVERSLGGVLFIDEAYSLIPQDGGAGAYASEAIATLIPLLETCREDLVVILAGYEEEMNALFASNPGLRSRVAHHLVFPPMELDQLQAVYEGLAAEHGYLMSTQFRTGVRHVIEREKRIRGSRYGNARAVRTLFEATLRKQAERLALLASPSVIQLQTLLLEDLPERVA